MLRKIAITWPDFFAGEASQIEHMLRVEGFERVHIRKPEASAEQVRGLIEAIAPELRQRLSLHSHFELAAALGVGGVHLNSRCPEAPADWRGLLSRSIHNLDEIASLTEDYALLSPIFPSVSKPGYAARWNLDDLRRAVGPRIFALGGVTPKRLPEIEALGFGGAAMLGSVWLRKVPCDAFGLQLITHPEPLTEVEGAQQALDGGCRWVQLRHKDADLLTLRTEGRMLAELCRQHGAIFIVDDHVDLAAELGADGVHLGKNDMPVAEARRRLGPRYIIGATANTFADVEQAWLQGADYVGVGPFRFTTTKANLSPVLGLDGYRQIVDACRRRGIRLPIVAIGGITDADIPSVLSTGVQGIALSGHILKSQDIAHRTAETLSIIQKSKICKT